MDELHVEHPEPRVAVLRIDRPTKRNALSVALRRLLVERLQALDADEAIDAIVLAGGPEFFAAGADLAEIVDAGAIEMLLRDTFSLWSAIGRVGKPMLAAVRGQALGGGFELALHADLIVAGDRARFGLPEIKVGLMPGGGGTQRLLRLVGRQRTLQYLLTGDTMSAAEAQAMGIVNAVVPDAEVESAAVALAARIATMPPLAVRQIREVVAAGADCPLEAALRLEHKALQLLCASEDKQEGIRAFLERRAPRYSGR